jgi:putative flippase GtrA
MAALAVLTHGFRIDYLIATAVAVEVANFYWHDRWTWVGESARSSRVVRFCRFNVSTGLISIVANVLLTGALVHAAGMPYLLANLVAIAGASVATYVAADLFVWDTVERSQSRIRAPVQMR